MIRSLAIVLLTTCFFSTTTRGDEPSEFAEAIDYAQARMVKIFGGTIGRSPGYATGIIVSPEGLVLTSQGVHLAADSLRVVLPTGETVNAEVVRRSSSLQAALLKLARPTPEFYDLSEETSAAAGDWVLAVSNAFKVADRAERLSVNLGVLGQRTRLDARRGVQDFPYEGEVLLLDAITSNPGAAGGAAITADGKLLGMLGKVIEGKNTNTRLNYAIPVSLLRSFVAGEEPPPETTPPPEQKPSSSPGELGIRLFALGGRKAPAFIDRVLAGSPAAGAGLKSDDLIVAINGSAVRNAEDYRSLSEKIAAGETVTIQVKRKNELLTIRITAAGKSAP